MSRVIRAVFIVIGYMLLTLSCLWGMRFTERFAFQPPETTCRLSLYGAGAVFVVGICLFSLAQRATWRKALLEAAMTGFFVAVVSFGLLLLLQSEGVPSFAYEVLIGFLIGLVVVGVDIAAKTMAPEYYM